MDDIDQIRAFNRFYIPAMQLLGRNSLDSGRSVTEARVLHDLSEDGETTARELALRLALDEGQVSRILAGLEEQGLLDRRPSLQDARQRILALTPAGQAEAAQLKDRSREAIAGYWRKGRPAPERALQRPVGQSSGR